MNKHDEIESQEGWRQEEGKIVDGVFEGCWCLASFVVVLIPHSFNVSRLGFLFPFDARVLSVGGLGILRFNCIHVYINVFPCLDFWLLETVFPPKCRSVTVV